MLTWLFKFIFRICVNDRYDGLNPSNHSVRVVSNENKIIDVEYKNKIYCNLKEVKLISDCDYIKQIGFIYNDSFISNVKIINPPTVIVKNDERIITRVIVPLRCNKFVAGTRILLFEPMMGIDVVSHIWINDIGNFAIGTQYYSIPDPDIFDTNSIIKYFASQKYMNFDNGYKCSTSLKHMISLIYKLKELHNEIQHLKEKDKL